MHPQPRPTRAQLARAKLDNQRAANDNLAAFLASRKKATAAERLQSGDSVATSSRPTQRRRLDDREEDSSVRQQSLHFQQSFTELGSLVTTA